METETYKKAKVILEKYAPEQIRKSNSFPVPSSDIASPNKSNLTTNVIAPTPGILHTMDKIYEHISSYTFNNFRKFKNSNSYMKEV